MCDFEKVIYQPELQVSLAKWGHSVNESRAWLLAAQRSIKRQVRGKESLLYFRGCNQGDLTYSLVFPGFLDILYFKWIPNAPPVL